MLARGVRSDDVRAWQLTLRALLGPPVASDGIFGAQTEAATRASQQRFHGPATGVVRRGDLRISASTWVVGPDTRRAVQAALTAAP